MSSNYMLYSSLSLIFTNHSMKMYYKHARQLFTQPQHLAQLLLRLCKRQDYLGMAGTARCLSLAL